MSLVSSTDIASPANLSVSRVGFEPTLGRF